MMNPIISMMAMSAPVTHEYISDIIKKYADAGIEQVLFYERGAAADNMEYMGEEWLTACGYLLEECAFRGIKVWLYDEFDCPSGTCHGAVMAENEDFYAKYIEVGNGVCTEKRYTRYSDILNPAAVDTFIRMTHDVYFSHFKEYFGTTIIGIFTDEPSFGYGTGVNSEEKEAGIRKYTYTSGIDKEYKDRTGRELFSDMAEGGEQFLVVYFAMLGEKFKNNYVGKLRAWCDAHGILMTGHLMDEVNTDLSLCSSGNAISALRGFSLPGMDEVFTYTETENAEWITLGTLQAAARKSGKGALAELTAFGPGDQPPERLLQMIRLVSLFGVNRYVTAISPVDIREIYKKRDWFHPVNYFQPWFASNALLGEEAKKAASLAVKTIVPEIYIRFPVFKAAMLHGESNDINETLLKLIRGLIYYQYQWQFLNEGEQAPEGARFIADYDTPLEEIIASVPIPSSVRLEDGTLPDEILVRRYTDGTFCVLDLTDSCSAERKMCYDDGKEKHFFTLHSRGMYVKGDKSRAYDEICRYEPSFCISTDRENTLRCVFAGDSREYTFNAACPLNIRLAVRRYAYDGDVTLDGKPVRAEHECDILPSGMNRAYLLSDEIRIEAGCHTVCISDTAYCEVYMPAVIICGNFMTENGTLCAPKERLYGADVSGALKSYCGKITYTADIDIPRGKFCIGMNTQCCYTKAYINGELIGEKIIKPFIFDIPEKFNGTVKLRIEQFTSIGPLFGEKDEVLKGIGQGRILYRFFPGKYDCASLTELVLLSEKN